jgi:hypothetical protein
MRTFTAFLLAAAQAVLAAHAAELAADPAATLAAQKKQAAENWEAVDAGESCFGESKHLLLVAPKGMEGQLKGIGAVLEKQYEFAWDALQFEKKDALAGKVTVYLFPGREPFANFVRRVEKRRVMADDVGSFSVADDDLHAAASPPRKGAMPLEAMAGQQIAGLLLTRKAGASTPLPSWLLDGFGRATYYRAAPGTKVVLDERRQAARLARARSAADVWNGAAAADEMDVLAGSLVDFLAYGPGSAKFAALVVGFKPGENQDSRTMAQAMEAAGIKADVVESRWKAWAVK